MRCPGQPCIRHTAGEAAILISPVCVCRHAWRAARQAEGGSACSLCLRHRACKPFSCRVASSGEPACLSSSRRCLSLASCRVVWRTQHKAASSWPPHCSEWRPLPLLSCHSRHCHALLLCFSAVCAASCAAWTNPGCCAGAFRPLAFRSRVASVTLLSPERVPTCCAHTLPLQHVRPCCPGQR